jgi:transposase
VKLKHLGSAHSPQDLQALIALAQAQLFRDQPSLFPDAPPAFEVRLKHTTSQLLFQVLMAEYQALFGQLHDPDFAHLCIARLVEPTSKVDCIRVLHELGVTGLNEDKLYRCLKRINRQQYREQIQRRCLTATTPQALTLVLYDVTTLYFETAKEDGYRKSGLSKERRLEPQIVIGLLVDRTGFPLAVHSFEGNTAETKTLVPVLEAFRAAHRLSSITVVADAAMMSLKNLTALTQAGYTYIIGSRLNKIPYAIAEYQKSQALRDQQIIVDHRDDYRIIYQYREKRAALDKRNLAKQLLKAGRIVRGETVAHHSKFVTVKTKEKRLNYPLIEKAKALVGIKGYVTNTSLADAEVITAYHQLFQVEKSFRMAKSDLKARPIFHYKREAIEAHLTLVLAALTIGRRLEAKTHLSLKHLVKLLRPIRHGLVLINGQEYPATPVIPESIQTILQELGLGY